MAVSSSGKVVAGLTAAALAAVGFLAYQASATAPDRPAQKDRPSASASPAPGKPGKPGAGDDGKRTQAVPPRSGSGERVVYSLGDRRVWLVGEDERPTRTYEVSPSTVSPPPGEYAVTSRTENITGSDGVPIEHSVVFTSVDGVVIGFSAAVDGSTPAADPEQRTGGIRASREDGAALWEFAEAGTKIVVVD
ncbi:L,D-transpeptidase [Streptomyces lycii]|uniref:L,D-transpeptidase n=1 Tax=Streptomyces lycii TaxID=2654337 RepID=UPI00159DA315|nr:L,D-transpeptidase [Streptomyces lycii]